MKKRLAIIGLLALPLTGCAVLGPPALPALESEPVTVQVVEELPPCPEVTYDGDINGPGPVWHTEDGLPPTYDCVGPGHVNLP